MTNDFENIKDLLRKNVRKYRKLAGLTVIELSIKAGFSTNYISRLERGLVVPNISRIFKIAAVLEVLASRLFEEI